MQVLIFVVTFLVMMGLTLFISRSRLGRACRACAEDIRMANLLGINTNNIIALTFVIGATLAAVAAVLLGMQYGVINPHLGFLAGIKAFTAAVLGGIGSIPGAMLGGLVLGVAEAFGADIFGDQYKDVVAFSLLVLVLLFRPTGILGRPEVEKYDQPEIPQDRVLQRAAGPGRRLPGDGPEAQHRGHQPAGAGRQPAVLWTIAGCAIAMFFWQLFRTRLMGAWDSAPKLPKLSSKASNSSPCPPPSAGSSSAWWWSPSPGRSSARAVRWTSPP